jgi:uncharacterized protein with PIN domain
MAISCTECGRQYDVTLFQFGRTIHCTCGARVGRRVEERRVGEPGEPRFLCDAMLGRLARWLRVLDYDTAYTADVEDEELVRRAWREQRAILTCDRRLPTEWRVGGCLVLEGETPLERLREVVEHFELRWPRPLFQRCLECNHSLEPLERDQARPLVPPRVWEHHAEYTRCSICRRVYWPGSHVRRMRRKLAEVFGDVDRADASGGGKSPWHP